jgi:hypothetical protein
MSIRLVSLILGLACAMPVIAAPAPAPHDGYHDFDFETGAWITKVRVLRNPLSGAAPDWAEYQGTSVIRPLMDGRANLVELSVSGTRGKIEGVALRLYNPQARQWSLNYASMHDGLLTAPVFGSFDDKGRGLFYGRDMFDGRAILVRFVITQVSATAAHFEQAYSADGGASWEVNWIADDTKPTSAM